MRCTHRNTFPGVVSMSVTPTCSGTGRHEVIWSDLPHVENFAHFVASVDASMSKSRNTQQEEKAQRTNPKHLSSCSLTKERERGKTKNIKNPRQEFAPSREYRIQEPIRSGESCPHFSLHCRTWGVRLGDEPTLPRIIIQVRRLRASSRGVSVSESGMMSKLVGPAAEAVPQQYLNPACA